MPNRSLDSWLSYIESQHPSEIELGLDRGSKVLAKLNLSRPKNKVITVAGTNGKGSTCAMLTQYLCMQGYSVGTYTSPHFLRFNERIALNNTPCSDDLICQAFEKINAVKGDVSLTYFEFSTLAAFWIFDKSDLDYWILEVGLGGRLDSVNMIDTDVAVVTSISLDHMDWLGDNVSVIAQEKAAIARKDKLLISGVVNPPESLEEKAKDIGAFLKQKGDHFTFERYGNKWSWSGNDVNFTNLPIPNLPLENAATVIAVLSYMGAALTYEQLVYLFNTAKLPGRFQKVASSPDIYIDVAHNPEASLELANRVSEFSTSPIAIFGTLKDKDIDGVVKHLKTTFSDWLCVNLPSKRSAKAEVLVNTILKHSPNMTSKVGIYSTVADAYSVALFKAKEEGRSVVVFGSFVTVSEYMTIGQ